MKKQNIYRLNEAELREMVNEAVRRIVNENGDDGVLGISFGIKQRQRNKEMLSKLVPLAFRQFQLAKKVGDELTRRVEIVNTFYRNNEGVQPSREELNTYRKQNQQSVDKMGLATPVKTQIETTGVRRTPNVGLNEGVGTQGAKAGFKRAARKIVTKQVSKQATRAMNFTVFGTVAAYIMGLPQEFGNMIEEFKNPETVTARMLSDGCSRMVFNLQNLCYALESYPEILGADVINKSLINGPKYKEDNNKLDLKQVAELAVVIGLSFSNWIGLAYDILDVASLLISAKAETDGVLLEMAKDQTAYISQALNKLSQILKLSEEKSVSEYNNQMKIRTQDQDVHTAIATNTMARARQQIAQNPQGPPITGNNKQRPFAPQGNFGFSQAQRNGVKQNANNLRTSPIVAQMFNKEPEN